MEDAAARLAALKSLPERLQAFQRQGSSRPLFLYELCRLLVEEAGYVGARLESLMEPPAFAPVQYLQNRECATCLKQFASSDKGQALRQALVLDTDGIPRFARPRPTCLMAVVTWACIGEHVALSVCLPKEQPNADELTALRQLLSMTCAEEVAHTVRTSHPVNLMHISTWMSHGLFTVQGGKLVFANLTLAQRLGHPSPEALMEARPYLRDVLAPSEHKAWDDFETMLRQAPSQQSVERRFQLLKADGASWTALLRCVVSADAPEMVSCSVLDTTMPAADALAAMETLSRAVLALSHARTFDELIHEITRQAMLIVPASAVNVFLYQGQQLVLVAREGYERLPVDVEKWTRIVAPETFATFQYMQQTRSPILIEDTTQSGWWRTIEGTEVLRSYIGVPLVVRGEVIGFLNVDGIEAQQFKAHDLQRLRLFAEYAASMLEQLRLVETLEAERNRLELLYNIALSLSSSLDVETVGARAVELLQEAFGALNVIIYLWNENHKILHPLCGRSKTHAMQLEAITEVFQQNPQRGLATWVFETGQAALVGDVTHNPHWIYVPGVDDWVRSALDVPLVAHGQTIGVLSLLAEQRDAFHEDDLRLLEVISVPMALALQNALFYQQAEQRAQMMAEALQQKEELEHIKQKVIEDVAHELRTPVAIIMGYTDALLQQALGEMTGEQERVLRIIERRARMLNELIESMMLLWKAQEQALTAVVGNFEPLDFRKVVVEVLEDFQTAAQNANVLLMGAIDPEPLFVRGNALLLHRLVDNLCSNALKFTPAGRRVVVSLQREGDRAVLEVCDEGIGIPPDKLELVFERFYRVGDARLKRKGLGLGLALVKTIVEAHGGAVRAISPVRPDEEYPGTCMRVTLPVETGL